MDKNFIEQELRIFAKEQTILLMQDNEDDIKVLSEVLNSFFKKVVIAKTYDSAKAEYIKQKFDMVIVSTDLENKYGGLKACKLIRDRNENQVIVLIGSIGSTLDTDMFIELLELRVATYIPHLLSIEFVLMKLMEQSEKIVYHNVEIANKLEIKTKAKEESKEKIKTKKANKQQSINYIENVKEIKKDIIKVVKQNQISAIRFIENLARKDNFKLLKYTIDNLNDLHYDFEKLIFDMVSFGTANINQQMKDDLVDILFSYEDSLAKLEEFEKLSGMFGVLGYYVHDIPLENFNHKSFDVMWYLNDDLKKLVHHIFLKKDVDNIHFLDESIISSLQQLQNSIDKTKINSNDADEIEIF